MNILGLFHKKLFDEVLAFIRNVREGIGIEIPVSRPDVLEGF